MKPYKLHTVKNLVRTNDSFITLGDMNIVLLLLDQPFKIDEQIKLPSFPNPICEGTGPISDEPDLKCATLSWVPTKPKER